MFPSSKSHSHKHPSQKLIKQLPHFWQDSVKPVIGVALSIGLCFMLINFLIDLAYGWLDPRLRDN